MNPEGAFRRRRAAMQADIEQIALNAIRYRSQRVPEDDSEAMAKGDRKWLLRYIDRHDRREHSE